MKRLVYLALATIIFASCGGGDSKKGGDAAELAKLKKEREQLDEKIKTIEAKIPDTSRKPIAVAIQVMQPCDFKAYVNVQSQVVGDENVMAMPQAVGTVKEILVHIGQHVSKGQTLAILDAASLEQSIKQIDAQLTLYKALYEKQQKLWEQNVGSEVQLMQAKAQYEATQKQKGALMAQRDMYKIIAPIGGTVDEIKARVGETSMAGNGIRIVNANKLKAEANLGETFLGKVNTGDRTTLVFPDIMDSLNTKLTYVSQAVDPSSRSFLVQVRLDNNKKLHPNMSCIMKIANYENAKALCIPVSAIQKTSEGNMIYVAEGNKAKAVYVQTGKNSNGKVEVLSGLKAGDKVVVAGYESLDNGALLDIQ